MIKSYFSPLLPSPANGKESVDEQTISEFARHHRDPGSYNQDFLDRYNRYNKRLCICYAQ